MCWWSILRCRAQQVLLPCVSKNWIRTGFSSSICMNRRFQISINIVQEPKSHGLNGNKELRYSKYFFFRLYRALRWEFKGGKTYLRKRNLTIWTNKLFNFCLMHTDFPLLNLYVKPQDVMDLKRNIQVLLHF